MPNPVRNISTSMKVSQEKWDKIFGKAEDMIVGIDTATVDKNDRTVLVKRKGGKLTYVSREAMT